MFMDNQYTAPQLLALMQTSYNISGCGTCGGNRKGFDSDRLKFNSIHERGTFNRLVDKKLGMVITRWKDSKFVQTASTIMGKGIRKVERRIGEKEGLGQRLPKGSPKGVRTPSALQ